jgi:hypothetical protein
MTPEQTAAVFGVTPNTWIAVEQEQQPWYQLPSEAVPAFATAVCEPVERLLGLLTIAARRALYIGIERRTNLSLGRFDDNQKTDEARRDTLRVAFARIQDENRGAARFLEEARRAAGIHAANNKPKERHPGRENR